MASQSKVMGQVTESVNFMIDKVKDDIVSNNVEREINLTTLQMRKLLPLIEASIKDGKVVSIDTPKQNEEILPGFINGLKDAYNRTMDQIINSIE